MIYSFSTFNRVELLAAISHVFPATSPKELMPIIGNASLVVRYLAQKNDLTHIETLEIFESRVPRALPSMDLDAA